MTADAASSSRTILLFGTSGQVGRELLHALAPVGRVIGLDRAAADFSRPDTLRGIIARHSPDVVVIAAAYTRVDQAESEPAIANLVNAESPGVLAREAESQGAAVVYYSTDYVFNGAKAEPWIESDAPDPLSVYGRTKRDGEIAVMGASRHLVLRTSWVFAADGANFLRTMLRLATTQSSLRVVSDQVGAPTSAQLIAATTASLLGAMISAPKSDQRWGLYHLSAAGSTSWHGYAQRVLTVAAHAGMKLTAASERVVPIATSEYPTPARRPLNSRLDTSKLRKTFGLTLPDWTRDVDRVVTQLASA